MLWSAESTVFGCNAMIRGGMLSRYQLMQQYGCTELEAAFKVAEKIDQARGIESPALDMPQ